MFTKSFHLKSILGSIAWIVIGFIIASLLYSLTQFGFKKGLYKLTIFSIVVGLFYYSVYKKKYEPQLNKIIVGIVIFLVILLLYVLALTYLHIPQYDFMCFYFFGKIGLASNDFYNPVISSEVFKSDLQLHSLANIDFINQIVNVGFWYPPPSMLLFLPLGLLDIRTAYTIWQSIVIFFLIVDIILIIKHYCFKINTQYKDSIAISLIITLIFLFPDVTSSVSYSQTISIFLFLLMLLIINIDNFKSGIFLGLLVVVKPFAVFFALYFIFSGKWKPLVSFISTGLILLIVTIAFFGYQPLINFLISPPTIRMPAKIFTEVSNQSLNSVLLRLQHNFFRNVDVKYFKIACYFLSFCVVALTIYSSRLLLRVSQSLSFLIYIPMAMLVYEATGYTYITLLLPVVLSLFIQKVFQKNILNFGMIFLLYGIGFYNMFLFTLAIWIILVIWPLFLKYFRNRSKPLISWIRYAYT